MHCQVKQAAATGKTRSALKKLSGPLFAVLAITSLSFNSLGDAATAAQPQGQAPSAQFLHDTGPRVARVVGSLVLCLGVLAAGVGIIYSLQRRLGLGALRRSSTQLRITEIRRISSKLNVVVIQTNGEQILLADNGQALLILSRQPMPKTDSVGSPA
jgi:flagellar biogenesis protein FliO